MVHVVIVPARSTLKLPDHFSPKTTQHNKDGTLTNYLNYYLLLLLLLLL